jgi:hypothetical protein
LSGVAAAVPIALANVILVPLTAITPLLSVEPALTRPVTVASLPVKVNVSVAAVKI